MFTPTSLVENTPSFSGNVRVRLKKRTLLFRYMVVINLILGGWYLGWRITESINFAPHAVWLSILLLIAEIYSFVGGVMFFLGLWRPVIRQIKSLDHLNPQFAQPDYPTVDIFITCYSEPVEMVEETARAALAMDYPITKLLVYILDDGNSPEMRAMSERLGLEDLQSPILQLEAERIEQERSRLISHLEQLNRLAPDLNKGEELLTASCFTSQTDLSAFSDVLAWFDSLNHPSIPLRPWIECQTVLSEAFTNAVEHAHQQQPPTTKIDIEVAIFTQSIQIRVWDVGPPFDLEKSLQNLSDEIDEDSERGRGLGIMQQLADHLSYIRTSDNRNCFLFIKSYTPIEAEETPEHRLTSYLQSFKQFLLLANPKHKKVSDWLNAERKSLQRAIHQKEIELTQLSRCRYIARPKPAGRPHHAKAGNINYAIFSGETFGDFIVTLDADHIPKPQFLKRVLPYFYTYNLYTGKYESNKIAFVQTPQAFYNLPPGDPFGHSATLFYGPIQQGKDGMNAAFYTGTNAMLRRDALVTAGLRNFATEFEADETRLDEFELIGGVSINSITEDMNTAMRLHNAGWQSVYHHEILAEGLAPDDLSSTLKQRLRWAQGTIQVLLRENPFNKPGLSFWQQLQYFQTMYSYFSGFFTLIFIACPIIYFFTGIIPVRAYGPEFVIHFVPAYVINRLTFIAASWGIPKKEVWRAEQFAIALFPLFIQAVWSVFTGKSIRFQVTPKQRQAGVYFSLVWPQLAIFALTILGIAWSIFLYVTNRLENPLAYVINAAWAIYNLTLLWAVVRAAYWQPPENQS